MIGKLKKITGSPAATVDYIFKAKRGTGMRGQLLGGTLLEVTPQDISEVLCGLRARRPDVTNPMHHAWASCPEGEVLGAEQWLHVGEKLSEKLGWQVWVAVRHSDTAHDHVHFVGSRIGWDGSVSREHLRDWRLVERVMRECEQTFHLQGTPSPERSARPHGRYQQRNPSPRHPKNPRLGRKDDLLKQMAECEALGYRSIKMLQELGHRGWTCDIRWKEGRAAGITWVHSSGARIRGAKIGRSLPWLRSMGGIPGLRCGRMLPANWVPKPIQRNRDSFKVKRPVPRTLGSSWWDRLASWAWQLVTGDLAIPEPVIHPPTRTPSHQPSATRPNHTPPEPPHPRHRR